MAENAYGIGRDRDRCGEVERGSGQSVRPAQLQPGQRGRHRRRLVALGRCGSADQGDHGVVATRVGRSGHGAERCLAQQIGGLRIGCQQADRGIVRSRCPAGIIRLQCRRVAHVETCRHEDPGQRATGFDDGGREHRGQRVGAEQDRGLDPRALQRRDQATLQFRRSGDDNCIEA